LSSCEKTSMRYENFYEIVIAAAKGKNPQDVVLTARSSYKEFSFSTTDLRNRLGKGGAREGVKSTNPR
jgi:hypothetical protein